MRSGILYLVVVTVSCIVDGQPQLSHDSNIYSNNSFFDRGSISQNNPLICETSYTPCCINDGSWSDEEGTLVYEGVSGAMSLYVTRTLNGDINLHRIEGGMSGMWRCDIPDANGDIQQLSIYLGDSNSGGLTSAVVSFTNLLSDVDSTTPQFLLTCRSDGGPATTVTWQRDDIIISDDIDHETDQLLIDTGYSTVYDNTLVVTGREPGSYTCTVTNNRNDFFGAAGSEITSDSFTVQVAGAPTRLNVVDLIDESNSILVTWNSPGSPAIGYKVYLQPGNICQEILGQDIESHVFNDLMSGVDYTVTIVALSEHLPSIVVGPVSPSTLAAPNVTISEVNGIGPYVDVDYTLSCEVMVPGEIVLIEPPLVEFEDPTGGQVAHSDAMKMNDVYTVYNTFTDLSLFSNGNYTCRATYTVNGVSSSTSPEGSDSLTLDVTIQPPILTLSITPGQVPYISNDIQLPCSVALAGVQYGVSVDVEFTWLKDSAPLPDTIIIEDVTSVIVSLVLNSISFTNLQLTDSGIYTCQTVITPREGTIPPLMASDSMILNVITPEVMVETTPSSIRVLDDIEYDNFSITCTASANADDTALVIEDIIWERGVDGVNFQPVPVSSYTTSGNEDDGYVSILEGSESITSSSVQYQCIASINTANDLSSSSTSTVTVSGPIAPLEVTSRVNDILDTSVVIVWTVPAIAYTPETYRVVFGTEEDNLDRMSATEESGTDIMAIDILLSLSLTGLEPETMYYYRVKATNSFDTTFNDVTSFTTAARSPDPPTDLVAELDVNDPSSLTYIFSWTPPLDIFILSYTVSCTPSLIGVDTVVSTVPMTTTTITLRHGLSYMCCVIASNDAGPSNQTCLSGDPITSDIAPEGIPLNLMITAEATQLIFNWEPPEPSLRNGDIISYTIQCSTDVSTIFTDIITDTSYTATDLTPNTIYTCYIIATNSAGDGPPNEITISTLEDVPSTAPRNLRHSIMNGTNEVIFQWQSPPSDTTNGIIIQYIISCNNINITSTDMMIVTTLLTPATEYSCMIAASTSTGIGPYSQPIIVLTVPGVPEDFNVTEVIEDDLVGLMMSWSMVDGLVDSYRLNINRMNKGDTVIVGAINSEVIITSEELGGYERVNIQVSAVNNAGYGPLSNILNIRTPAIAPGPVRDVTTDVIDDILNISWTIPDYPNGIISGYNVTFELYMGDIISIDSIQIDDNMTLTTDVDISSLDDGVPYIVVVIAVNNIGAGERATDLFYAGELTASAIELVNDKQTRNSNGDIILSWETPDPVEARGKIIEYRIEFREAGTNEEGDTQRKRQNECPRGHCILREDETSSCCTVGPDKTTANITGLDPSKDYEVSVIVYNSAGAGETQTITIMGTPSDSEDGLPIVIIGGVAGGAVIIIIIIILIIIIIVIYRRWRRSKSREHQAYSGPQSPSIDDKPRTESVQLQAINITRSPEEEARMKHIELSQFEEHVTQMHQDRDKGFELEYQTFSTEPTSDSDAAKNVKNKNKNRFANIFPYDNNRVRLLELDGMEGSDYINASFINGYSRSNAYIAAQGPMSGTITDFWRMIWEHKPTTIVMLTKQVEGGKRKCEVYWPEKVGGTFNAGSGIHVQYKELIPFADYEIKIFSVSDVNKPSIPALEVHHFQFLSWPDHGVPTFATALISFIRRLRQHHNPQSSMLVHCSAGVGRTGTFIILDSMLERIMSENTVNVYEFLTRLRQQRVHMVQTLAQYVFIHDALVELITCGDTYVSSTDLRKHILKMHKIIPEKAISGFTDQFRLLNSKSRRPTDNDNSDGLESYNVDKNRYPGGVPYNMNRVRLRPTGVTGAEYINASFLDGYKQRMAYLATQAPLENTVNDFWRMMWEFKSRAIVMLCQLNENGEEMSYSYWPSQTGVKQLYGKYVVTLLTEETPLGAVEVIVRKFQITDDKNTSSFGITQYHVMSWPENGRMKTQLILLLINHLNKLQRSTENKPITVMCNDGMGRTGTFICIHAMLERMNSEGVVDFFQFIKASRINRPDIVREQEHYILCHDTVADYLDTFQTYANFT